MLKSHNQQTEVVIFWKCTNPSFFVVKYFNAVGFSYCVVTAVWSSCHSTVAGNTLVGMLLSGGNSVGGEHSGLIGVPVSGVCTLIHWGRCLLLANLRTLNKGFLYSFFFEGKMDSNGLTSQSDLDLPTSVGILALSLRAELTIHISVWDISVGFEIGLQRDKAASLSSF